MFIFLAQANERLILELASGQDELATSLHDAIQVVQATQREDRERIAVQEAKTTALFKQLGGTRLTLTLTLTLTFTLTHPQRSTTCAARGAAASGSPCTTRPRSRSRCATSSRPTGCPGRRRSRSAGASSETANRLRK